MFFNDCKSVSLKSKYALGSDVADGGWEGAGGKSLYLHLLALRRLVLLKIQQ